MDFTTSLERQRKLQLQLELNESRAHLESNLSAVRTIGHQIKSDVSGILSSPFSSLDHAVSETLDRKAKQRLVWGALILGVVWQIISRTRPLGMIASIVGSALPSMGLISSQLALNTSPGRRRSSYFKKIIIQLLGVALRRSQRKRLESRSRRWDAHHHALPSADAANS